MRILKVEPGKAPYAKEMEEGLKAIQREVEGLFQPLSMGDGVILCCNDEGKLNGMQPNRRLGDDIICGPFFLVGDDHAGGFCSLTEEQIQRYLTMRRMYAYLTKHRCIDRDVVTAFVQEKMLYEDDPHHNCVFVGLDENGEARHAHLRSTGSQGKVFRINVESSDIKHSFHKNGTDRSLYVFEAPIDLLSHITLYPAGWLEHSYVACCGTSIQPVLERLRQNPKLDTVYLCLDNDEAGEDACDGMLDTLEDMGYDVERLRPEGKDWNDDLRAKRGKAKTPTA